MRRGLLSILLFLIIVNTLFVSATYSMGNLSHNIASTYGPGSDIQGWINISITNENIDAKVRDSLSNEINILDLLKNDVSLIEDVDYSCNPLGCGATYTALLGEESKTITLNSGERKVVGFKFSGTVNNVNYPRFNISSNAGADCSNQLKLDIFSDGIIETGNDKYSIASCASKKDYGCFDYQKTNIEMNPMDGDGKMYCQKINLMESPAFDVGAWLEVQAGAVPTKVAIFDINLETQLGECELSVVPSAGGERSCRINTLVTKRGDYYVCLFNEEGIDDKTKIKSYPDLNGCGFYTTGLIANEENYAYQIFAEGKKFAPVGTFSINEDSPMDDLGVQMSDYITDVYGSTTCPTEGCVVPMEIISNANQEIIIDGIYVSYASSAGPRIINTTYNLELSSAKISTTGFKKISLSSSKFVAPTEIGFRPYTFFILGQQIFVADITIEPVPEITSINPMTTVTHFPTNFHVSVDELLNASIDSYSWKFGSSNPETTTTDRITHTFYQIGSTPVTITVTDMNGKSSSKTFNVNVGDYQGLFLEKLTEAQSNILNITTKLSTFSQFYQDGIKEVLDADEMTRKLTAIKDAYDAASLGEEYTLVVNNFLALDIPVSVFEKTSTNFISFYTNPDYVNINVVREFLGGDIGSTSEVEYANAVADWSVRNINSQIKYKRINANYESRSDPILSVFELNVKQIGDNEAPASIFIKQLENMQFDKAYGETVKAGYIEIPLSGSEKTVTFLTTEDLDITTVPIFVSPALNYLPLITLEEEDPQGIRWALFVVIIIFLIFVGLGAYIFLQYWYKTKYETYLFKNRNFLFNLIHYIDVQKKKGAKDSEIFRKLKQQGWNSEQIDYVIKKYLGKRTGMLELPVEKILNFFKKQPLPGQGNVAPRPGMNPPIMRPRQLRRPLPRKKFPGK